MIKKQERKREEERIMRGKGKQRRKGGPGAEKSNFRKFSVNYLATFCAITLIKAQWVSACPRQGVIISNRGMTDRWMDKRGRGTKGVTHLSKWRQSS